MAPRTSGLRRSLTVIKALSILPLLSLTLVGCGGSSSSSNAVSIPAANVPAVVSQSGLARSSYTISLLPSGSATYNQSQGIIQEPTLTGTVPEAVTTQFFRDLTAAMPLQNLPIFPGTTSTIAVSETVQYQGQTGHIDNPNDAHEQALAADVVAIAKALGLPQS